jgi:hypothetical protein
MTARNKKRRTPARRFRPRLEVLEGRDVPSTLTVTSVADSGPGSLRAEIAAASSGDTIVFAPGLNGTIILTSGELDITKSLTIQGPGASQLAVSGGNASCVIEVDGATTNVTLSGLTITQGNNILGNGGGGIFNNGSTVTLSGCAVTNSTAAMGGGIYNEYGTMSITNSTISGNSAMSSDGGNIADVGGGLYNQMGSVTMTGCTLSNNLAAYEGGAVYTYDAFVPVVSGTKKNSKVTTTVSGTLTMTGCTVTGNTVDFGYGAAFYNASSFVAMTISDTAFSDNGLFDGTHHYYGGFFSNVGAWIDGGGNTFTYP